MTNVHKAAAAWFNTMQQKSHLPTSAAPEVRMLMATQAGLEYSLALVSPLSSLLLHDLGIARYTDSKRKSKGRNKGWDNTRYQNAFLNLCLKRKEIGRIK